MKKMIYIKNKKNKTSFVFKSFNILTIKYNNIFIYTPFPFIYVKNAKYFNLENRIDSYTLKNNNLKFYYENYLCSIFIKEDIHKKIFIIRYNCFKKKYCLWKNVVLRENTCIFKNHKHINSYPFNFSSINSNQSFNFVDTRAKEIVKYYNYWIFLPFLDNVYSRKRYNNKFYLTKDITTNLTSIEIIFESRVLSNKYLIPINITILTNINFSYEKHISMYIWTYNLYFIKKKNLLLHTYLSKFHSNVYEKKTSILLPNNVITSNNYSLNIVIFKLFNSYLNYYNQECSTKLSHLFIFNLIVESLYKQYAKNGIVIPIIQFELIVKKMTSFVKINCKGESFFMENDIFEFNKLRILNIIFVKLGYIQILYSPIILGISKSILAYSGLLSSISFQNIVKYLIKLSLNNSIDLLTDFKSKIITTDLIKTGSGWYRHFIKI